MPKFEIRQKLPPCRVNKVLLVTIEEYLISKLQSKFSLPENNANMDVYVIIKDRFGTETHSSAKDIFLNKFSDTTNEITMSFINYSSYHIRILFALDQSCSHIYIEVTGDQSRETAIGLYQGILSILEPQRYWGWLFHPDFIVSYLFVNLIPLSILMFFYFAFYLKNWYLLYIAIILFLFFSFSILSYFLIPYTSFDSRSNETKEKIWLWFFKSLISIIPFGTAITFFVKKIISH
jgi:hypothetical protein